MRIYKGTALVGIIDSEGHMETSNPTLQALVRRGYVILPSKSIQIGWGIQDEVVRIEKRDPKYGEALVFALERDGFLIEI